MSDLQNLVPNGTKVSNELHEVPDPHSLDLLQSQKLKKNEII